MKPAEEEEFRTFVAARMESLRRTAFLLCRDWYLADDLVSITIGKLFRHWHRVTTAGNTDAYVRGVLIHAFMDETRRPWRREHPAAELPEEAGLAGRTSRTPDGVARQLGVLDLLAELPPQRRAVVVLRFYCDMSVEQTAHVLGLAEGTVKSQAAKGLDTLRHLVAGEYAGLETP